jgi:RHS repeat-associated protein
LIFFETIPVSESTLASSSGGNMMGKGGTTYAYDPLNRLTQVVSGTITVQFAYNGDGVRVGKTVNGASTDYVQDVGGALPVVVAETTGGQMSCYIYANELETWVDPAGSPIFYHTDGLGSVRALSNGTGQSVAAYTYDTFGAVRSQTDGVGNPFTFISEQTDAETELIFLQARYYDPEVGGFLNPYPFPGLQIAPQSLAKYPYVQNNPVLLADHNGQFVVPVIVLGWFSYNLYSGLTEYAYRVERYERRASLYYSGDFDDPRVQELYESSYSPYQDFTATYAYGMYVGATTPGTSFSGPPLGAAGRVPGVSSLVTTGIKEILKWILGAKLPQQYRYGSTIGAGGGGGRIAGDYWGGGGGSWSGPPSGGK